MASLPQPQENATTLPADQWLTMPEWVTPDPSIGEALERAVAEGRLVKYDPDGNYRFTVRLEGLTHGPAE